LIDNIVEMSHFQFNSNYELKLNHRRPPIVFNPDANVEETLYLKFHDATEIILGPLAMEEWIRFSVCFWHSFRETGKAIYIDIFVPIIMATLNLIV
jgi:hypothetical protein